ncbi:hypothetical protein RKD27_001344 [Streptomyces sp. SAI-126]|uniref:hypothetical protein n=1 Tax=unclassified Streptomyces TaxID=2593676 RepID=UPI00235B5618|nr:hypothetical protein [Streptomyces sp. TUS-ST3]GLP69869.1 hypothetical protein TUSST3_64900 [Streptomyces sp. TUS-ST3]
MSAPGEHTAERCTRYEDLPVNPFVALRVAYGMLLGEDDFSTLLGNPRGKHMLHASWSHGPGVVWGFRVRVRDDGRALYVAPGLALDGLGRELTLGAEQCVPVADLLKSLELHADGDSDGSAGRYRLVAVFDTCLALPVPALASPCDASPGHSDHSRAVERVRFELRRTGPGPGGPPYPRLRQLFSTDRPGPDPDPADWPRAFQEAARQDVLDLAPALDEGDEEPSLFPVGVADAPVTLAVVGLRGAGLEATVEALDQGVLRATLPTGLLQDLVGSLRPPAVADAAPGAPRVVRDSLEWSDEHRRFTFSVTAPLHTGSVGTDAVSVSSLGRQAWERAQVREVVHRAGTDTVTVVLAAAPRHELVRVVVHGTGPTPVLGTDHLPLAGLTGGPPGTAADGHDAVIMYRLDEEDS